MTVRRLIERLEEFPDEMEVEILVGIHCYDTDPQSVETVELEREGGQEVVRLGAH